MRKNTKTYKNGVATIGYLLFNSKIDILGDTKVKTEGITRVSQEVLKNTYSHVKSFSVSDTYKTQGVEYVRNYTHEFVIRNCFDLKLEHKIRYKDEVFEIIEIKPSFDDRELYVKCKGVKNG